MSTTTTSNCWFDYNVPFVDPGYYKIGCKPLLSAMGRFGMGPGVAVPSSISGAILISATEAQGLFWGPDVLNPYEVFKRRRPDALIGNVVLVYNGTFDVPLLAAHSRAAAAYGLLQRHQVAEAIAESGIAAKLAPDSPKSTQCARRFSWQRVGRRKVSSRSRLRFASHGRLIPISRRN